MSLILLFAVTLLSPPLLDQWLFLTSVFKTMLIVLTQTQTVKPFTYCSCLRIVVMLSGYYSSCLMFLDEPKFGSTQQQVRKEGHPGLITLICLRSGIWSECMFVFHYASTTNPFYWESSLPSYAAPCVTHRSWSLKLKLEPPEVKGDWVTLDSGAVGVGGKAPEAKSVAINNPSACVRGTTVCL